MSYKIVKTCKGKGKNCLGIIRFVFAQKVSPKAACNAIFHYGSFAEKSKKHTFAKEKWSHDQKTFVNHGNQARHTPQKTYCQQA